MISVKFQGDLPKLRAFSEALKPALEAAWEEIAAEVTIQIEGRCPTPDAEYDLLMRGGNDYPLVGRSGESSSDNDERGATKRFIRFPGVWLEQVIAMPGNWTVRPSELYAGFGNPGMLDEMSRFSWVTYKGETRVSPPMWTFFEEGKGRTVTPRGPNKVLHPAEKVIRATIDKDYPAYRMYSGYSPIRIFNIIEKAVKTASNA